MKIVILAGGSGTRFWPRSVKTRPKQFLSLTSHETMLQQTYRRYTRWLPEAEVYVVTAREYKTLVEAQLPELSGDRLLLEPEQRDTGPCIALTAQHFLSRDDDEVLVTMPSDHFTDEPEELVRALRIAAKAAERKTAIVTLGVVPTRPETGYGYIRTTEIVSEDGLLEASKFIEKPSLEVAEKLIRDSGVFWNSGIFVWKPSTIAHYMRMHQPFLWNMLTDRDGKAETTYSMLPKISIDYAILEKADSILTIPVKFKWDDVGIWTSLERIQQANEEGNILNGLGHVHAESTRNSIIYTDHPRTMVIGVNDLIIVSTEDGLLVCHKSEEQRIKSALQALERQEGGT
ncbi:mannose-1-phosphate guanylyltransferase [Paenibacillus hemerocallicola]|uniref:Mannose-1-phosphate guanylyltransferase n=1 Tax=Paenibacillus hemerocallicola TaxID=1172614 RepID=A0A5C4TBX4_9BACL|nr:sugar phosphate nucleotidyltransferase [Paenibacillus hemerocallicola]TNJ66578.1 mannose-1-phosphate guanylyltransferase [Paenibacillus hemerocallicola]